MDPISRPYWMDRLSALWKKTPVIWLSGVRRTGKTTLAGYLDQATFINCDLPSSQALLKEPENFYAALKTKRVVFDEIHQLDHPSEILKIGADQYGSKLQILATGSSTLAATQKFQDSLTGRKRNLHLVPILPEECISFGIKDIRERLLRGGLPPALLAENLDLEFYAEWIDSFYARDVQELFQIEKRQPFIQLFELLLRQNAGLFEASQLAKEVGLSRPTIVRYLEALEITQAITVLRPFHQGGRQEIIGQPKVYGFDTGFVSYTRGWTDLRPENCGHLLENLVLESLQALSGIRGIYFWRTKQQHEIDFIVPGKRDEVHAIECKWKASQFEPRSLKKFREDYPHGKNFLVTAHASFSSQIQAPFPIEVLSIEEWRSNFLKKIS